MLHQQKLLFLLLITLISKILTIEIGSRTALRNKRDNEISSIDDDVSPAINEHSGLENLIRAPSAALLGKLLNTYQILARPTIRESDNVTVNFALTLLKIINLNEDLGILESVIWETLEWNDPFLVWNPADYSNITSVRIPVHRIWKPDIYAYNSANKYFDAKYPTDVVVRSDGGLIYIPPGIHSTTCKISYTNFPFDEQTCSIKFGSWTMSGHHIDIKLNSESGVDISSFIPNSQWTLTYAHMRREVIYYTCCSEPYLSVTAEIGLKRKGETILSKARTSNAFICFTLFLSFVIPVSSRQKIRLAILHLAHAWYTSWALTSQFPHLIENSTDGGGPLVTYFQTMKILSKIGLGANIFTVWLYYCSLPMSTWVRKYIIGALQKIDPITRIGAKRITSVADGLELIGGIGIDSPDLEIQTEWSYLSLTIDRCFLVFFTIVSMWIWVVSFPSFK